MGAGEREVAELGRLLDVEYLQLYELRANNLTPLSSIARLRHLKINWNTKLTSLDTISGLRQLKRSPDLEDTPKILYLDPLAQLTNLEALEYSGGIYFKQHQAESLEPLVKLPNLKELTLIYVRVKNGGLRPLAHCKSSTNSRCQISLTLQILHIFR